MKDGKIWGVPLPTHAQYEALRQEIADLRARLEQAPCDTCDHRLCRLVRNKTRDAIDSHLRWEQAEARARRLADALLAYRARAYQYAYPSVVELDKEHEAVLDEALAALAPENPPPVAEGRP